MDANFEYYKVFYYCAHAGNITTAAKMLCLTQPTVTKTIQNLEAQLGCTLFYRSKKGIDLTEKGQLLYDRIGPACELMFLAGDELEATKSEQTGVVCIGVCELTYRLWLRPRLQRFCGLYPKIRIKVNYLPHRAFQEKLANRELDFAILNTPLQLADSMESLEVAEFQDIIVCGRKYQHLTTTTQSLGTLVNYPIVMMAEEFSSYSYFEDQFSARGLKLEPMLQLPTLSLVRDAVEQNLGISSLPYELARDGLEAGRFLRIYLQEELPKRSISIVTNRMHPLGVAANTFLAELGN